MKPKRNLKKPDTFFKLILEDVIGLTTKDANGLASNSSSSKFVYIAGCVAVVYNVDAGTQSHLVEVKLEWGKGLAQKREAEARKEELELEKAKPFARTRDDPDLDRMLKDRLRWGDPMAHLVKKKHTELVLPDMGDDEKMKASGFIVPQDIPHYSWLRRGLEAAPNRYGIKPGRHWDGVDRSTGFEQAMFKRMNEKQATEREAYLWSVSDM